MPQIDMPLDKLKTYEGRNPRPADFDAYWDRAIAEMKAVDPKVELKPAKFQVPFAECFHLYFTGVKGARVHAKLVKPKTASGKMPAIVEFHGYTGRSPDWTGLLGQTARGYVIAAMDCRGQGGSSEDTGGHRGTTHHGHIIRGLDDHEDRLLFRDIFLDTAQLAGIVMNLPEVDPARVGAQGGSQGGALTLACAALEPRIKKAAATFPFLCDYKRVWEMDLAKDAYAELRTFFRHFDPQHDRETAIFTRLGYIDCQYLAPRIRADTLFGIGLMDTVCPPSTQFAAYNKIVAKKRAEIFPDFGHENLPGFSDTVYGFMNGL
jgi:cephalosporin-C deacetylase